MDIQQYFESIEKEVKRAYEIASEARKRGSDPEDYVDIPLAKNLFERVEGLVGALAPQVVGSGIAKRLEELDKKFGSGDWRVALTIAEEVAREKFCKFKDQREAIEVGIRVGLAYITMGVVSAPLEGFIEFKIKERMDGKKYASCYFAGPIRAAGGTAAAVTLLIADYLRRKFGLEPFDITKEEIERTKVEVEAYHHSVARLQYFPTPEELDFLLKHLPIEINGDPTSDREVLIYKDLPRVGTPKIRGGMCLVLCEGLAQKAPKLLKRVEKWGKDFSLSDWTFLKEYVELKTKMHSGAKVESKTIQPNDIYIQETVAGRPVFSYPMRKGGFRLRYGRSRLSGLAAASFNPATMHVLGDFIATGSQLRLERPGKACAATPCDTIDGPVVKLNDESVVKINTLEDFYKYKNKIKEILFLGDILVAYGEFTRNNHVLVPSPYVEEWWIQEFRNAGGKEDVSELDPKALAEISIKYNIPLHPSLTFFFNNSTPEEIVDLFNSLKQSEVDGDRIIIPHNKSIKKVLEEIYLPHKLTDEGILIEGENAIGLLYSFGYLPGGVWPELDKKTFETPLDVVNSISKVKVRDRTGIYVGARLGRPEKAKLRKMKGSPHVLFPVSSQGGRMRSLNAALEIDYVESQFPLFRCEKCGITNIYPRCPKCGARLKPLRFCVRCGKETDKEVHCGIRTVFFTKQKINVKSYVDSALSDLGVSLPPLVKGVRGTSNKLRIPEPIEKGILRALHNVYVNKDGTIRYDAIETPITHFRPKEIGTSVEKLRELGYTHDIYGKPLENPNQILELLPQDVILPDCEDWQDTTALQMVYNTAAFVDDLLEKYYKLGRYYNISSPKDMVGKLIIALAPHTSAGMIGRIIGFSKTQCFFAHPYFHSAVRRNCFVSETEFYYKDKETIHMLPIEKFYSKFGHLKKSFDADGTEVIDLSGENVYALGTDLKGNYEEHKIKLVFRRKHKGNVIKLLAENNQEVKVTKEHKLWVFDLGKKKLVEKRADEITRDDLLVSLNKVKWKEKNITLYLPELFENDSEVDKLVVRTSKAFARRIFNLKGIKEIFGMSEKNIRNYLLREPYSIPLKVYLKLKKKIKFDESNFRIAFKRNFASLPVKIVIDEKFAKLIGYYISEGWIWKSKKKGKESYHVAFAVSDRNIRRDILKLVKRVFGVHVYVAKDSLVLTNKLLFKLIGKLGVGRNAHEKQIPEFIFNSREGIIYKFLEGIYQGDGTVGREIKYTSVSEKMISQLYFLLTMIGMKPTIKCEVGKKLKSGKVFEKYINKNKAPPAVDLHYVSLYSSDVVRFANLIFLIGEKGRKLKKLRKHKIGNRKIKFLKDIRILKIKEIKIERYNGYVYDIELDSENKVFACGKGMLLSHNCDGDELGFMLLMDALLNFSRQYLPDARGSRHMDAPLVLTTRLIPEEVDDEVYNMDIVDEYPIEFYEATQKWMSPYDVKIKQVEHTLGTPEEYYGFKFTHDVSNMNIGNRVSAYKTLTTIADKVKRQMELADKIKAVDKADVARIVIEKHFLKDIKGNLRKFTRQEVRCIKCNEKYRRIPLSGKCTKCGGKLVLTVSEGTVSKYLEPSLNLAEKYSLPEYLKQSLEILKRRVESVFGKEPTKQKGLTEFFGG